jgi:hypothetical protein
MRYGAVSGVDCVRFKRAGGCILPQAVTRHRSGLGFVIQQTLQARATPQSRPRAKGQLNLHPAFLIEFIEQDGGMTMFELAGALKGATSV